MISPSDNSGWGVGCGRMRATGVRFTLKQPVRVKTHYRSQWGQKNGRRRAAVLRQGLKNYLRSFWANEKRRKRGKSLTLHMGNSAFSARLAASAVRALLSKRPRKKRGIRRTRRTK